MARSRSKAPARAARSSQSRAPKPRSAGADVEVVEDVDSQGGFEAGIAIATFIVLIAAIVILDLELGQHYGDGVFFKNSYSAQG